MFMGEYNHNVDGKGRMIFPAKFREELGERFVITKGLDNCLFVYAPEEWRIMEEKLRKLSLAKPEARAFARFFFAGAAEVEPDKQGRVLIPNNLREYGKLDKDVVVIGVSTRIEIWARDAWDEYNAAIGPEVVRIAENLADLGI